jgi:hypothetical protein
MHFFFLSFLKISFFLYFFLSFFVFLSLSLSLSLSLFLSFFLSLSLSLFLPFPLFLSLSLFPSSLFINYLRQGAFFGLVHDVSMASRMKFCQLIQNNLNVSNIQSLLLVKLLAVALLLHVLHEEVGLRLVQLDVRTIRETENDVSLESRVPNKLFEVGNEVGIGPSFFLSHHGRAVEGFSFRAVRSEFSDPVVFILDTVDQCFEIGSIITKLQLQLNTN